MFVYTFFQTLKQQELDVSATTNIRPQEQQEEENAGRQDSNVMQLTYEVDTELHPVDMGEQGKQKTAGAEEVNNST